MLTPRALIIAGPNGAGKTTFARELLPHEGVIQAFFNADLIATGLAPFAPESAALAAAKLMAQSMDAAVRARQSFAVESTLAGRSYLARIRHWKREGYEVKIIFLRLSTPELALQRVHERVLRGGHGIPEEVVRHRFTQGWNNFTSLYRPLADEWYVYDNDGPTSRLVDAGANP